MLTEFPRVKAAWETFGCPAVRKRLANDEFEAAVTVTPEMVKEAKEKGLLTERNLFAEESGRFNTRNVDILAGQILRDGWIEGHKEVCIDRDNGKVVAANHTLLAVEAAGRPIKVTARFGCDPRVEAADGTGTQTWSTGARIREPDIYAAAAFAHYRIHHGVNRPPDAQLAEWIESHRKYLERVVRHLPKTERGSVQPGFKQAALVLALVEACERTEHKLKEYPAVMGDFLETLQDPIEGKSPWAKLLRDWVITHARGHSNKEMVYGASVSILKRHLSDEKYPSRSKGRPQIREKSRWDDALSFYPDHVEQEKLPKDEHVLTFAKGLAKHLRVSVREKWLIRITNALLAEHGNAMPGHEDTYLKRGKAALVETDEIGRRMSKYMSPFSERAAIRFALKYAEHPMFAKFLDKPVQKVVSEDWRLVCYSQERLRLNRDTRPGYDFEWLAKWFENYANR